MASLINDDVIGSVMTSLDLGWRHSQCRIQNDALGWIIPFYKNYQLAYMDRALVSFEQCLYKWWAANLKMLTDHIHVISIHLRHRRHQCNLKYIILRNTKLWRNVLPFRLELRMKHASSPNLSMLVDVACWRYFTARRTGILAWPAEAEFSWLFIGQFRYYTFKMLRNTTQIIT